MKINLKSNSDKVENFTDTGNNQKRKDDLNRISMGNSMKGPDTKIKMLPDKQNKTLSSNINNNNVDTSGTGYRYRPYPVEIRNTSNAYKRMAKNIASKTACCGRVTSASEYDVPRPENIGQYLTSNRHI